MPGAASRPGRAVTRAKRPQRGTEPAPFLTLFLPDEALCLPAPGSGASVDAEMPCVHLASLICICMVWSCAPLHFHEALRGAREEWHESPS